MKLEDIKIGMKVVPHSKSILNSLEICGEWNNRGKNQGFLYVSRKHADRISLSAQKGFEGNHYLPSDFEPYQEPNTMITQEEFDNLKEGDVLVSKKCEEEDKEIIFQGKLGQIGLFLTAKSNRSWVNSFTELQKNEFSLVKKEPNFKGFALGEYVKPVAVKVWNDNETHKKLGIISNVTENGIYIQDSQKKWEFAELIQTIPITLIQ
jgi:hypothetical protein